MTGSHVIYDILIYILDYAKLMPIEKRDEIAKKMTGLNDLTFDKLYEKIIIVKRDAIVTSFVEDVKVELNTSEIADIKAKKSKELIKMQLIQLSAIENVFNEKCGDKEISIQINLLYWDCCNLIL